MILGHIQILQTHKIDAAKMRHYILNIKGCFFVCLYNTSDSLPVLLRYSRIALSVGANMVKPEDSSISLVRLCFWINAKWVDSSHIYIGWLFFICDVAGLQDWPLTKRELQKRERSALWLNTSSKPSLICRSGINTWRETTVHILSRMNVITLSVSLHFISHLRNTYFA